MKRNGDSDAGNAASDVQLADALRPLLHELMERLIVRGEASSVSRVSHLLCYVVSDFGKPKELPAPADTNTRPMFDDQVHQIGGPTQ